MIAQKKSKKIKETLYFAIHKETNTKIAKKYKKSQIERGKEKKSANVG